MFLIISVVSLVILGFILNSNKAFLYSKDTHYSLTQEMIKLYNLKNDPDLTKDQIELILKGSMDEDTLPRQAFHLYDPIYNRAPFNLYTAKTWATDYGVQRPGVLKIAAVEEMFKGTFIHHGDYSWQASLNYYANNNNDEAFYGLGHILHLVEDMTVPAHSRNDHHITGDPYESWIHDNLKQEDYDFADDLYRGNRSARYLYNIGDILSALARYSNGYFFSKDTIESKDYEFPEIVREKAEDFGPIRQRTYLWGEDENGKLFRLAFKSHYKSNWLEISSGQKESVYLIEENDPNIHKGYWQRLAPKAVLYGARAIEIFLADARWEKERLALREPELSWLQKAEIFLGLRKEKKQEKTESSYSETSPMRFPVSDSIDQEIEQPLIIEKPKLEEKKEESEQKIEEIIEKIIPKQDTQDEPVIVEEIVVQEQNNDFEVIKAEKTGESGGSNVEPVSENNNSQQSTSYLIINEVQIRNNEFIELYNPTSSDINLASYSFAYYSESKDWNDPHRNQQFPSNASISSGGYYLIGLSGYVESSGNPDADWQPYSTNQLSNSNGSIAIFPFDPSLKTIEEARNGVIDVVAWASVNNVKEGTEFQDTIGIDKSIQRKSFQDTDNNNSDFEYKKIPTPINSNLEEKIPGTDIPDNLVISSDTTWTIAGSPYWITANSNQWPIVESGATLTIEPGVVIMPRGGHYTFLEIKGELDAQGTSLEKIVFTSIKDSDYGGAGGAAQGDWMDMIISGTAVFENVIFRYGGDRVGLNKLYSEMVKVDSGTITMKDVLMEKSESRALNLINSNSVIEDSEIKDSKIGILIQGGSPTIDNCIIKDNSEYGLEINNSASPQIKNNSFENNGTSYSQGAIHIYTAYPELSNNQVSGNNINGVVVHENHIIGQNTTWNNDLVYVLFSSKGDYPTVASGSILTLEPNTVIKGHGGIHSILLVQGELIAQAASSSEIVFTSFKDDSFGGDTNNDSSATSPNDNDWKNIKFDVNSTGILDHVFIYYADDTNPVVIDASAVVQELDVDYDP